MLQATHDNCNEVNVTLVEHPTEQDAEECVAISMREKALVGEFK